MILQHLIAIIDPEFFSGALSYISYLLTFINGLYNLVCAVNTFLIIFYLVDFVYGTNGMWMSFSNLFLKVLKKKIGLNKTNNELLHLGIVPDISQAPSQGAKIHREGLYKDKDINGMIMAVYQVSCTVYAPITAEHPSIAFVDEEYGEDIDGKFVSKGINKNGVHHIQFKLNLKDFYGEPLDDYHHVNTLDMVEYRTHSQSMDPDVSSMEDINRFQHDVSLDRPVVRTLRSSNKKQRAHYHN
jgi:hypothetical protein